MRERRVNIQHTPGEFVETRAKNHRAMRKWYAALWLQDTLGTEVTSLQGVRKRHIIVQTPGLPSE